ncbi:MAG: phosphate-selective porin O and [Planctomycetota bacterium]|nr:MAG: phosphate-selective porin O and [Planctomycetota bacterium]
MRTALVLALLAAGGLARAQGSDLESRVRALELPTDARPRDGAAAMDAWFDKGLRFATSDGAFQARIGASFIFHGIAHWRESGGAGPDGFLVREAAIELGARFDESFEAFVSPVFLPGSSRLLYGWVEFNRWDEFRIRAGLFKEPFSMETLEETRWWDFAENSVVYMHAPVPDLGVMAHGRLGDGLFRYWLGVFNGNGPGNDGNSDKDVAARLLFAPPRLLGWKPLRHVHAGVSATHGRQDRRAPERPFPMFDPGTGTDFHSNPAASNYEIDTVSRVSGEFAALLGPVEAKAEFSWHRSRIEFDDGSSRHFRSPAFYGQLGVWIAGRRVPFGVPEVDSPLFTGGFGAVQIAGRFARMRLDDLLIDRAGFDGARRIDEFTLGLNWFPNENVRVSLEFIRVRYRHGRALLPNGDRTAREDAVLLRFQLSF